MAQLQGNTRIYGILNIDTQANVASGNVIANATGVYVNNYILVSNAYLSSTPSGFSNGQSIVVNTIIITANSTINNAIFSVNNSTFYIGNTTVNTTINSTSFYVNGYPTTNVYILGSTTSGITPPNTYNGALWFDTDTGILAAFYASQNVWVAVSDQTLKGPAGYQGSLGYTGSAQTIVPVNNQTAAYVAAASDSGGVISITTGGVTVNSGVFSNGQLFSIFNNSTTSQTITLSGVTCYLGGTATTGNRTLAQRGMCTITCLNSATNLFTINGSGLS